MAWAAIWQKGGPLALRGFAVHSAPRDAPLQALTLWLEIAAPRVAGRPVRIWQGAAPENRAIAAYLMPDGALRVLHGGAVDVATPPGFAAPGEVLILRIVACAQGRHGVIDLLNADTGLRRKVRTRVARPPRLDEAFPRAQGFSEIANVAAVATHPVPATDLPGIGSGARIATPDGNMPVEQIAPGMTVLGDDGTPHVVRWTDVRERLCLGRTAPILLRAPYFGLEADICVTPDTRLVRQGADVEYLAGTDAVLVRAGDLVPGVAARHDRNQPLRRFHHLMLDDPACIRISRCRVETAFLLEVLAAEDAPPAGARPVARDCAPSLPLLDRAAARTLLSRTARAQSFVT
ncbi:Hint domain-containing protein [Roseibacterium sp. SDUM158017]|uniref:Hint domain-containing protein n=1 Tax=Roseicyclus salinarum TaxID=3036773 RepID=UPI0024151A64|nr:Hint domain-containing protein [Roseibacterium sp. SDUM158017]MDG4647076.1 Hint domain-containing protein [Roseibacterium sp. SDUM158017]